MRTLQNYEIEILQIDFFIIIEMTDFLKML